MSWTEGELGDFLTLKRGHDLPNGSRVTGEVPVVSSSGFTGWHNEAKAAPPGVVTGRYGTIGEVFYVDQPYWPLNTALYVIDFKGNIPKFIAYFLREKLKNYQSDKAAVPGVDRKVLHRLPARCPDQPIQQAIVSILSAYDDLIENNQRRIALLEEAVRQLFKEWFIRIRFPGNEHVQFIDGLPEGWKRMTLREVATLHYGKALKEEIRIPGEIPVYGSSGIVGSHSKALVAGPGIILGRKGNVGSVRWSQSDFFPIDTVYFISSDQSNFYLYLALQHMHFMSTDVAVPGLNRDFAYSRSIVCPEPKVAEHFEEVVGPFFSQIQKLTDWNSKLIHARDLILPKLMNGSLTV